ncbi:MAG TPA: D-sedoheptulose 7-phosphate isomerase [Clostridia bacterium]|nr:D-sedoheptulose 7-phosphate isomerase [Clostridia bacterium]
MKPAAAHNAVLAAKRIEESIAVKQLLLNDARFLQQVTEVGMLMADSLRKGGKVFFFGNGGSAADAQHLAAELTGRYLQERTALAGLALNANTSALTAIGNDYSFDHVFARQLQGLAVPGDVALGISTSGNSRNVLQAMRVAEEKGMLRIGFAGFDGGLLRSAVDYCLCIPSSDTPRIQEAHILTGHILCEIVESELFANSDIS